jgi:ribosomal protein S27E
MHALLKSQRKIVTEFACRACGSPAVVYPDRLSDEAPVKCQRCSTVLCTLREFRLSAEQGIASKPPLHVDA